MPRLKIVYSTIYDMVVQEWRSGLKKYDEKKLNKISSLWIKDSERRRTYALKLQTRWAGIERKAFATMERVSGLKWKERNITCYIVDTKQSVSDPLTIGIYKDWNEAREALIHELGHRLEFQNLNKIDWDKFNRTFERESNTTKYHILLHAVLKLTYLKLFGKKKTTYYINSYNKMPEYKRAWQIVNKYGAENLIRDFIGT